MTRCNRRISAQERLSNKAVELLVAKPKTRWWMSYLPQFTIRQCVGLLSIVEVVCRRYELCLWPIWYRLWPIWSWSIRFVADIVVILLLLRNTFASEFHLIAAVYYSICVKRLPTQMVDFLLRISLSKIVHLFHLDLSLRTSEENWCVFAIKDQQLNI